MRLPCYAAQAENVGWVMLRLVSCWPALEMTANRHRAAIRAPGSVANAPFIAYLHLVGIFPRVCMLGTLSAVVCTFAGLFFSAVGQDAALGREGGGEHSGFPQGSGALEPEQALEAPGQSWLCTWLRARAPSWAPCQARRLLHSRPALRAAFLLASSRPNVTRCGRPRPPGMARPPGATKRRRGSPARTRAP
jgi:hypothetical protein